jgi:hypothetical protein
MGVAIPDCATAVPDPKDDKDDKDCKDCKDRTMQ